MELLLKSIAKHVDLNEEEKDFLCSKVTEKTFKAKELLLKENEICHQSFFVIDGILQSYNIDEQGVKHTLSLATTGWWIADMYSFLSGKPGQLYIEAIENTTVLCLRKEDQQLLFDRIPKIDRYFRILIENSLIANQQRIIDNLSLTAEERYDRFCEKYPIIKDKVPQIHIASYLGVTPEFFSKMKRKLLKGN
ncbi:Crp/Fnr family transcriptional regulator [Flavobacterium sp. NKUCC04_CG]|uniref:Crp/Fnr family transcriptional regulator n=1 Tax=Flavobacterium sp. NKUCC04_CG TaxID=2842121 RepID=UPI001C5AEA93|nr:Crp/Fnr family transcriptional regulator [Flavobacterium sp. NKUCC04_CG]MBW3519029.1 Crp/Fnr family transcriptional regulator [Flavobacterium sp. NKUCC04_CG]